MSIKWLICLAILSFIIVCEIQIVFIYLSAGKLWENAKTIRVFGSDENVSKDVIEVPRRNVLETSKKKLTDPHHICQPTFMANKNGSFKMEHNKSMSDPPHKFDWRNKGIIRPVMFQGYCKGCWAISIVETMESMAAKQKIDTSLTALSVQQLLDCSTLNDGCNGGDIGVALSFLCSSKLGITTAEEYPNIFVDERCRDATDGKRKIAEYWNIFNADEKEMVRLIFEFGPLVAVVNSKSWTYYTGGVIQNSCVSDVQDHVIQIVGYDKTASPPYYIIRNSWGEDWGINGYVKLAMNRGVCGINRDIAYFHVI